MDVNALLETVYKQPSSTPASTVTEQVSAEGKEKLTPAKRKGSHSKSPERKRSKDDRSTRKRSPKRRRLGKSEWSRREKSPPELSPESQAEQDARTVFVSGLPIKATMKELYEFFEKGGKVKDISLISDRNSRRSKGIGYIQYESRASIPSALALSGTQLNRHTICIQATMAEKNRAVVTKTTQSAAKILVSNLDSRLTDDDVAYFFEQVGEIDKVQLKESFSVNPTTQKVFPRMAVVIFKKTEDAKKAVEQCNGYKILEFTIRVENYSDTFSTGNTTTMNNSYNSGFNGLGSATDGELDGGDGNTGIRLDAQSRLALMNRLSRSGQRGAEAAPTPLTVPGVVFPPAPQPQLYVDPAPAPVAPSVYLVLKNMFDPAEAKEDPELYDEVKESVVEECAQFGKVISIHIDKNNINGLVYIKLDSIKAAEQTIALLNGRYFAGKRVSATFLSEETYNIRTLVL